MFQSLRVWMNRFMNYRFILEDFATLKELTDTQRDSIIRAMFEREFFYKLSYKHLSSETFVSWTDEIVQEFPTEKKGVYYLPAVLKTKHTPGSAAVGKILQHLHYVRNSLNKRRGQKRPAAESTSN